MIFVTKGAGGLPPSISPLIDIKNLNRVIIIARLFCTPYKSIQIEHILVIVLSNRPVKSDFTR